MTLQESKLAAARLMREALRLALKEENDKELSEVLATGGLLLMFWTVIFSLLA